MKYQNIENLPFASIAQETRLTFEFRSSLKSGEMTQSKSIIKLAIEGDIEVPVLESALNKIIDRHEVLRTSLVPVVTTNIMRVEGWDVSRKVFQALGMQSQLSIRFKQLVEANRGVRIKYSKVSTKEIYTDTSNNSENDTTLQPFDYEKPPFLRAYLSQIGQRHHQLLLSISHLVFDEWSRDIFLDELVRYYDSLVWGNPIALPHLSMQFAEVSALERKRLESQEYLSLMKAYCERRFSGFMPLSSGEIGFASPRRDVFHMNSKGGVESLSIDPIEMQKLRTFVRQEKTSLYVLFISALTVALGRSCGKEQIALWTFLANRTIPETQNLIGWFANDHVICVDLSGNPSVTEILGRVQSAVFDAVTHQDVPFGMIERSFFHRRDSGPTVFPPRQHRVSFEKFGERSKRQLLSGNPIPLFKRIVPQGKRSTSFALRIVLDEKLDGNGTLYGRFCEDCFEPPAVINLLHTIRRIACEMSACKYTRMAQLPESVVLGKPC